MIKTLRITGSIALLLTAFFVFFLVVDDVCADERMDELLKSPTIMDRFRKPQDDSRGTKGDKSPLVQEAEKFAMYLNPPAPKPPKRPSRPRGMPAVEPKPKEVSVKFKLVGTSYYASNPDLSLALIDEPGKGFRWVRQSDKVGRITIEQIKDGVVVVSDGSKITELRAKRPPQKSLLRDVSSGKKAVGAGPSFLPVVKGNQAGVVEGGQISDREMEQFNQLVDELRALESSSPGNEDQMAARLDEFVSGLGGVRISDQEANSLDSLGKKLEGAGEASQKGGVPSRTSKIERKQPVKH